MKISFDADGCLLDNPYVQVIASSCVKAGEDVWILTSREGEPVKNRDLYAVMEKVGIPKNKVIFFPNGWKVDAMKKHKIDCHFDDDYEEIYEINKSLSSSFGEFDDSNFTMPGILVNHNWDISARVYAQNKQL
jgi:uncharacterized HAD superfamily protein